MSSKAIHNPYELLTDELVKKALRKQFGGDVQLQSYEVIDFTEKGDNFASIVTSLQVQYEIAGIIGETSYIGKLSSTANCEEAIKQFLRQAYLKEPIILGPILDSMNKILLDQRQEAIKAPRCFSSCDEPGKEALLEEDLRPDDFVMADKMKGLDIEHANMVVKELGRFHACSILYENKLNGSTYEKTFPALNDPNRIDPDHEHLPAISNAFMAQFQMAIEVLNWVQEPAKHAHIVKWWNNLKKYCFNMWFRCSEPFEKFNVLSHGDCWMNNLLFRYDQNGKPIDIRLLDFQMSSRSSPAADLMYFFYSTLTGVVRKKYKKPLLVEYYLSFSKILLFAHQSIPFTFEELEKEFDSRMLYGCITSMIVLSISLTGNENALDLEDMFDNKNQGTVDKQTQFLTSVQKNPAIKMRFLSMFEDMTQAGIFEKFRTIYNPYKLLTEELVEEAIQNDFGKQAKLKAFEVRKFTNKGDNYASTVIAIYVHYEVEEIVKQKVYVVKLNPQRDLGPLQDVFEFTYQKEMVVLTSIANGMNKEMMKLNLSPLKVPRVYAFQNACSKEIFVMNNLKNDGFIMFDRTKGMDVEHAVIVLKELGRWHASSLLYQDSLKHSIREEYQIEFDENWVNMSNPGYKMFNDMLGGILNTSVELLANLPKYEKVIIWINSIKDSAASFFIPNFESTNKFNVLSHGDCWNNNILFKYNEDGHPSDIRLVDFQGSRITSVAFDLCYFMYNSISGDIRQENMDMFLVEYYLSFCNVLLLANRSIPFTLGELKKEVKDNIPIGCVTAMTILPFVIGNSQNCFSFDDVNDTNMTDSLEKHQQNYVTEISKSELFHSRFLSIFDEMIENGFIK